MGVKTCEVQSKVLRVGEEGMTKVGGAEMYGFCERRKGPALLASS